MENSQQKKAIKAVGLLAILALVFYVGFILLVSFR